MIDFSCIKGLLDKNSIIYHHFFNNGEKIYYTCEYNNSILVTFQVYIKNGKEFINQDTFNFSIGLKNVAKSVFDKIDITPCIIVHNLT